MQRKPGFRIVREEFLNLGVSLRRHYVDDFHFRHVPELRPGARLLDLGGTRLGKRGFFNVEQYGLDVVYVNLSTAKQPHVQAEAAALPFRDGSFHAVICSELLEHVPYPPAVLAEAFRVLDKGGVLFVCVPFLNRIHGDPYDYGRYTDYYWARVLREAGFARISIERQGLFWAVLVDMLRDLAYRKASNGFLQHPSLIRLTSRLFAQAKVRAIAWDSLASDKEDVWSAGFTTGFGIRAVRE
jgi:SAM-dependent methyltransferase